MKAKKLIQNKYYCLIDYPYKYYFKFQERENNKVYNTGYFVEENCEMNKINYFTDKDNLFLEDMEDNYDEILFEDIVEYLPDDNIDRKHYIRCKKIKFLLNVK